MAVRVFVSYRRTDSRHATGRLRARLVQEFGRKNVFYDVDSLAFGADFREAISGTLQSVDVLVLVIGPNFDVGRLAAPNDYVSAELTEAFALKKQVIPVLVDDARMPEPALLPEALAQLSYRNAAPLRPDPDFDTDAERLVRGLRQSFERRRVPSYIASRAARAEASPSPAPRRRALGTVAAAAVVALIALGAVVALVGGDGSTAEGSEARGSSSTTTSALTSTTSAPTTTSTNPTPTSTVPPTTPSTTALPPASPTTTARVARTTVTHTCGITGRGDCFLSVRTEPTSASDEVVKLDEGTAVELVCQVPGERVEASAGGTSNVWARTSSGHYVAAVYVRGAGFDPFKVTTPYPA